MKHPLQRVAALALTFIMLLQVSEGGIAYAAQALNPAAQIELRVPDALNDGNNYFFIRRNSFTVSEKSGEKLYIPVQRSGNLDAEAEVTLKVIELTARHGVNYELEVYKDNIAPEIVISDTSLLDVVQNADGIVEEEPVTQEEVGQLLHAAGGAAIVDIYGNPIGSVTATPMGGDSDSDSETATGTPPTEEADATETEKSDTPATEETDVTATGTPPTEETDVTETGTPATEETDVTATGTPPTEETDVTATGVPATEEADAPATEAPETPVLLTAATVTDSASLMAARNAFTGTLSDRQELSEPENGAAGLPDNMPDASEIVEDAYPGREYRLRFKAGQQAQFVVITPMYSPENDGDSQIMLTLKDPSENMLFPEDFGPSSVTIIDEDEPEAIVVSMAAATVYAQNGEAAITVTRTGRLKSIAGVRIASWDGSAKQGEEYGGVGAELYFPMGITERTIELPVGHGVEEKDFHVTITDLTGVEIGTATTRVVILAAPVAPDPEDAELLATSGTPYGDDIDLKSLKDETYGSVTWNSSTSFKGTTPDDTEWKWAGIDFYVPDRYGYFYDGMRVDHQVYANFCKARVRVSMWNSANEWHNAWVDDYTGEGVRGRHSLNYYYGTPKAPGYMFIAGLNRDNTGWPWTDDYMDLSVYSVKPILRQFDITVAPAAPLTFEGMTPEEVLTQYERVNPNDNGKTAFSVWSGENFSIPRVSGATQPRYVGVEAVRPGDGKTYRLANIEGKTNTVMVELTRDIINYLAKNNYITWSSNGGEANDYKHGTSYSGAITVRPVFEYENVTVEVRDTPYGVLKYNGKTLSAGTHTFHKGDKLVFEPNLSDAGMGAGVRAVGVGYVARKEGRGGALQNQNPCILYITDSEKLPVSKYPNGACAFTLEHDYYEFWQAFSEEHNAVRVRVPQGEAQYFDTDKGLFAGLTPEIVQGYEVYTVRDNVRTNELAELMAVTKDASHVPLWTLSADTTQFSGSAFYFKTGALGEDNLVTLRADRDASKHALYQLSGSAYSSTMNLATGEKATDSVPAIEALITAGTSGIGAVNMAVTDLDGRFSMNSVENLVAGTSTRYTVSYNGNVSVRETRLPPVSSPKKSVAVPNADGTSANVDAIPVNVGALRVDNYSLNGAHFASAYLTQAGRASGIVDAIQMNGKRVTFTVTVDPGQGYLYNGQTRTENIKDVALYFENQYTGEVHGRYSIHNAEYSPFNDKNTSGITLDWNAAARTATLTIERFTPDRAAEWTYGDALMLQLTTDKQSGVSAWSGGNMVYDPVSSGYAVYTDLDYVPETFNYDIDNLAEMLQFSSDDAQLSDSSTRYSFGEFPYLGEITAAVHVFSMLSNIGGTAAQVANDAASMDEDDYEDDEPDPDAGFKSDDKNWKVNVYFNMSKTPYGGMRFLIGVAVTTGGGEGYTKTRKTPYRNARTAQQLFLHDWRATSEKPKEKANSNGIEYIYNDGPSLKARQREMQSAFGGTYFTFGIYFGLYLDYGYIRESTTDSATGQSSQKTGEMVFMGAGGFISFKGSVGVNFPFWFIVPMYFAPEASADLTFYIGSDANPMKTLQSFQKETDHKGQDFQFNVEVMGTVKAGANIGIGLYKVLGGRIYVGVTFELGYGMNMTDWYPNLESNFGTSLAFESSGTIDLIITSISLYSASFPITGSGWMKYMDAVIMSNRLIGFVEEGISEKRGSEAARNYCRDKKDALINAIDNFTMNADQLDGLRKELLNYAKNNGVITGMQAYSAILKSEGGLATFLRDTVIPGASSLLGVDDTPKPYFTRDHVKSEWTAGEQARLMSAFKPVRSDKLLDDAFAQTSGQIQPIGGGKYLVVFLGDDNARDRMQAATLMYNIYDADAGTFAYNVPRTVQNDRTADGKPHLIDAGDKLILTWASTTDAKYQCLRDDVAAEIGSTDADAVIKALEDDPARVMSQMDVFVTEFDKASQTFGEIVQLTDDNFYDDYPQAVYDSATGDYIVLYYKTAQTASAYSDSYEKLQDLIRVSPNTGKTYSVLCYMLYNNQSAARDTNGQTHEAGWARNYLFPKETALDAEGQANFLAQWGGQRFLSSPITSADADGKVIQSDPPIADMTVCNGYNGLAAFAFTVDKDYDLQTAEDKELYVQFYKFADHSVYVPTKVAGDITEERLFAPTGNQHGAQSRTVTEQVDVGTPKLIRNNGSTWLFWRENRDGLRYLNVSEMLNDKVLVSADADPASESSWTYALKGDGSFSVNPDTGKAYAPNVQKVDFGSLMTSEELNLTDYQVITDNNDNLYVVWTQNLTYQEWDEELQQTLDAHAQEIYAVAKISETDKARIQTESDESGTHTSSATPSQWSKPCRLTRDNTCNDGLAIALDDGGGLIILHNQFTKLFADSEEKMLRLVSEGKAEVRQNADGETNFIGSLYYDSPISLMLTRCDAVGSVEATNFGFSDMYPVPGEKVLVTAYVENTGLTTAEGFDVDFYAYKDGKRGEKLHSATSDEQFPVNSARKTEFVWTVPAEGAEGYSIQAVAREHKSGGAYYEPVTNYSGEFTATPAYDIAIDSFQQNGDTFDVEYHVRNVGNAPAAQGMLSTVSLQSLYGDLKELYGMDNDVLLTGDISGLAARETKTVTKNITIPVSVFSFCGYDAVKLEVSDSSGMVLESTDDYFVSLDEPLNLSLNHGQTMILRPGESVAASLSYDSTVFMDKGAVLYSVDNPGVASVDENGNVTALDNGTATLTATLLPSGRTANVQVSVSGGSSGGESGGGSSSGSGSSSGGGSSSSGTSKTNYTIKSVSVPNGTVETSAQKAAKGETVTITLRPDDGYKVESVTVKTASGKDVSVTANADGSYSFVQPSGNVTITPVYAPVASGNPATPDVPDTPTTPDVPDTSTVPDVPDMPKGYTTENPAPPDVTGVSDLLITDTHPAYISGFSDGTFRPNDNITRAQAAVMFYRLLKNPDVGGDASFTDMRGDEWYAKAVYALSSLNIIQGYADGAFHGNDRISRVAFTAIATRLAKNVPADSAVTFADVPAGHWAQEAISGAASLGWIGGYSDGSFRPGEPITRAAVTAIINRMLARNADKDYVAAHSGELNRFSDVTDSGAWYYDNVMEAANAHSFTRSAGKEIWNK